MYYNCMRNFWLRLKTCEKGAAALEFAIAAPVIITFMVGIMEIASALAAEAFLDGGLREAARYGVTGNAANDTERRNRIVQIVANHSHGMLNPAQISVETKVYPSFVSIGDEDYTDSNNNGSHDNGEPFVDRNGNGQWDPDGGAPGVGGPSEIVVYRVSYNWNFLTGLLNPVMGDHVRLASAITVRNEPY